MNDTPTQNLDLLRRLTASILDVQRPAYSLRQDLLDLTKILADAGTFPALPRENISDGETHTSNGIAISPIQAAMCAADIVRTVQFLRGTHAAIARRRGQCPNRAVQVLYAGCGPYATLAVPLMSIFAPGEVKFTILDLHPGSIESVKSIIETLGLGVFVDGYEVTDAGSYRIRPDRTPDVIVIELMRACLEAEPQVAVTRHLLPQAPDAILIPEEVRIDLVLVNRSREFDLEGVVLKGGTFQRDRIAKSSVFVLNREAVHSWQEIGGDRLPGSTARIPDPLEQRYQPMLFTTIRVFQDVVLKDYASGLTLPQKLPNHRAVKSGDLLQFHYELGQYPQLRVEVRGANNETNVK